MAYEEKAGSGTLNISKYFEEGGKKPKWWGKITFDEATLEAIRNNSYVMPLSGWERNGQFGMFISLTIDTYQIGGRESGRTQGERAAGVPHGMPDNDVPF